MPKALTCYLPNITAHFCIGIVRLSQSEALQRHDADIVVSDITKLGGQR